MARREDNLIYGNKRTHEELVELGRKGGKASGVARRRARTVREAILAVLYAKSPEHPDRLVLDDMAEACAMRILEKGDPADLEKLLGIAGMTPEEKRREKEEKRRAAAFERQMNGTNNPDVEDLTPLADLLND